MEVIKYIEKTFSNNVEIKDFNDLVLPFYLHNNYSLLSLEIANTKCLLIVPKTDEMNFSSIIKHYEKFREISKENCVLVFDKISTYRKKKMVEENIPFIITGSQVYIPFLGVVLSEEKKREMKPPVKFMAATQLVMLFLYYNNQEILTVTEIAKETNLSKMTISRAIKDLLMLKMVKEIGDSTRKKIVNSAPKHEFLCLGKKHLTNPVQKIIYLKNDYLLKDNLIAGMSALSEKPMLAANQNELSYAIYKKLINTIPKEKIVDKSFFEVYGATIVELWKYDPRLLTKQSVVDDISLILTLKDIPDERTEKMLNEIKEVHQW